MPFGEPFSGIVRSVPSSKITADSFDSAIWCRNLRMLFIHRISVKIPPMNNPISSGTSVLRGHREASRPFNGFLTLDSSPSGEKSLVLLCRMAQQPTGILLYNSVVLRFLFGGALDFTPANRPMLLTCLNPNPIQHREWFPLKKTKPPIRTSQSSSRTIPRVIA